MPAIRFAINYMVNIGIIDDDFIHCFNYFFIYNNSIVSNKVLIKEQSNRS